MHRLAQAARVARQHETAPALRQFRDPGQRAIAPGAVHQRRPQQGGIGAARGGGLEHGAFALTQALRDIALLRVGRTALDLDAGRAEREHASGVDARRRIPAREVVERAATEDRIDLPGRPSTWSRSPCNQCRPGSSMRGVRDTAVTRQPASCSRSSNGAPIWPLPPNTSACRISAAPVATSGATRRRRRSRPRSTPAARRARRPRTARDARRTPASR